MITVPAKKFENKDIYIAVYCTGKCKYILFLQFKESLTVSPGQLISLDLQKDNVFFFKYNQNDTNAQHLEILTYTNSYITNYRMYVAKGILGLIIRYCSFPN
jgi:hypothetical protein